ncbi:hypothetical protein AQS8620_02341 [Aquimixticola soesokkakensis]|uniref:Lipoprotein n=1 Tax=Aquimixticola soesokkakensis TaxID=1519096 RepID=A0A1Y5T634_9RHOB|nr:hypothetical protein [Aquimixticola soesokkakensis]SLN53398.1 hypothetical protein AQS8620_02341 [Aquimixticola soesokkakensis]
MLPVARISHGVVALVLVVTLAACSPISTAATVTRMALSPALARSIAFSSVEVRTTGNAFVAGSQEPVKSGLTSALKRRLSSRFRTASAASLVVDIAQTSLVGSAVKLAGTARIFAPDGSELGTYPVEALVPADQPDVYGPLVEAFAAQFAAELESGV